MVRSLDPVEVFGLRYRLVERGEFRTWCKLVVRALDEVFGNVTLVGILAIRIFGRKAGQNQAADGAVFTGEAQDDAGS
jgi:hypothetical protein